MGAKSKLGLVARIIVFAVFGSVVGMGVGVLVAIAMLITQILPQHGDMLDLFLWTMGPCSVLGLLIGVGCAVVLSRRERSSP